MAPLNPQITLGYIATLKLATLENLQQYLMSKGINIPADENYVLNPSELKAIDPILAYKLKTAAYQTPKVKPTTSIDEPQKVIETVKEEEKPEQSKKEPCASKILLSRHIGIVKFFDSTKGWGYIVTNSKGFSEDEEKGSIIKELFVHKSRINSGLLREGQWVTFDKYKDKHGFAANQVQLLSEKVEDILVALKYTDEYSKIEGWDSKHERQYDEHIVAHVLDVLQEKESSNLIAIDGLSTYFNILNESRQAQFIKSLFGDPKTKQHLVRLFIDGDESCSESNTLSEAITRYILEDNIEDISLIIRLQAKGHDITSYYPNLRQKFESTLSFSEQHETFLRSLSIEQVKELFSCEQKALPRNLVCFLFNVFQSGFLEIFEEEESVSDEVRVLKFVCDEDYGHLDAVKNWDSILNWMSETPSVTSVFLPKYIQEIEDDDEILNRFTPQMMFPVVKSMSNDDERLQFIQLLPELISLPLVTENYAGTALYNHYVEDKWEKVKSELPYVVFDLEVKEDNIQQFAFYKEANMRLYDTDEQIRSLGRALTSTDIIVGHNIKQADLPLLAQKGITISKFIWDTLEIEILLNPCRYAYSLHTKHNAEADTRLTDKLFWNQLYRLSLRPDVCNQLNDFLPVQLSDIISQLQTPLFADYFKKNATQVDRFFQELLPLKTTLINKLQSISSFDKEERSLIIAPMSLWPRISLYVPLYFPVKPEGIEFMSIDKNALSQHPLNDYLANAVLERFCEVSVTPIVANLAQYLRVKDKKSSKITFTKELLSDYIIDSQSNVDCIDISAFDNSSLLSNDYKHIYIIGSERQDRVHKVKYDKEWSFSDLLTLGSKIPLAMASTNITLLSTDEISKLHIQTSELTANVWAERQWTGKFAIFQNYKYRLYRNSFLSHFNVTPEVIRWSLDGEAANNKNLFQVRTFQSQNYDATQQRVSPSTTMRSKYWVYQFALICKIHEENPQLPIVFVINSAEELSAVTEYAQECGFFVPIEGTGFRKLEYIDNRSNGMVIITKERFINEIGSYRTDRPYCYIWDNMDIDRYQIMWDTLPFDGDIEEAADDDVDEKHKQTTVRQCILAAWPIFEHYHSIVMANSDDTKFYVLDPHLEDYNGIAKTCNAQSKEYNLWANDEEYKAALATAEPHFPNTTNKMEMLDTKEAMELVRPHFIGNHTWREEQRPLMEYMMERRGDCVISMPTGGGKSVLFQAPSIYRATYSHRLSLVVTPLRALMQDQVEELQAKGFATNVDYLSSDRMLPETQSIYRRIKSGEIALLYITPERFRVRSFMDVLYQRLHKDGGLEFVIFDEAHCISQWGQDFRPDYRHALESCVELKTKFDIMIALFSATVTTQVEDDLRKFLPEITKLGETPNPIREHISISFALAKSTKRKEQDNNANARVKTIAQYITDKHIDFSKSCMLVFCRTHNDCIGTADQLNALCLAQKEDNVLSRCADHIDFFHAGLDATQRNDKYKQFRNSNDDNIPESERIYILCTTKAFGMGMDIPNVHYVVHYNPPSVLEDYLQEVGRAGRNHEMYLDAFTNDEKIPALCITSEEDFKHLKDLLVRSQMSWSDLTDCKNAITNFIQRFKSLDDVRLNPIVVPYNVWIKSQDRDAFTNVTPSRLAFHWLDHIGYLKLKFLNQAYLDITVSNDASIGYMRDHTILTVLKYLRQHTERDGEPSLFSIVEIKNALKMPFPKIMNAIIECQSRNLLELNDSMMCMIGTRRYCEARYMAKKAANNFALRIVFNGLSSLLSDCVVGQERFIDMDERAKICKHLMDDFYYSDILIEEKKKGRDNIEKSVLYMPWKNEIESVPRGAVTRAATFHKDILGRTGQSMFRILRYIPGVQFKRIQKEEGVTYRILVKDDRWKTFLPTLERDCLKWLYFICDNTGAFKWSSQLLSIGFEHSGDRYSYFDKILSVLKILSYIDHTPLTKTGIEVLSTDKTAKPIDEGTDGDSDMYAFRQEFDAQEHTKKVRLACMNVFALLPSDKQSEYIRRYFLCRNYDDYFALAGDYAEDSNLMAELTEEALKEEEKLLESNMEQLTIYNQPRNENVNVLAGPGSGKTHVLTLRCAKLIYKEHVEPHHLLVLAYNRAVVVELRNRLDRLFTRLGMSRIAHKLHVHTFHALAKVCMGNRLNNVPTERWEGLLLDYLQKDVAGFKGTFPDIQYVLVDEFQDITKTRLASLIEIHKMFPNARFFTIGDINQSIYGFDRVPNTNGLTPTQYAAWLNPQPYYQQLGKIFQPVQLTMFRNYRSYQKILDASAVFVPVGSELPHSAEFIMNHEPQEPYTLFTDNIITPQETWEDGLIDYIQKVKETNVFAKSDGKDYRIINTIAVFFRTNNEVYRGYSAIKSRIPEGVRVRIQGTNSCELWREREVFDLINTLNCHPNVEIELQGEHETARGIKGYIQKKMDNNPSWDKYLLDVTFTLVLNYIDSIRSDEEQHTWAELANYIIDIAGNDDGGQVYKIYDRYKEQRILQEDMLTIVLTTMHKVKGLEFDAVFITPSSLSLPMKIRREYEFGQPVEVDDLADIEEERRLMFVAYTRARKFLHVYKGLREHALEQGGQLYIPNEDIEVSYTEREPKMSKYNLSYTALERTFTFNDYISRNVKCDDQVVVEQRNGRCYIRHGNSYIGQLANANTITSMALRTQVNRLQGFFVSDVCVWTYNDSVNFDNTHNTNYSANWHQNAIDRGFIYIVQIAGFGKPF